MPLIAALTPPHWKVTHTDEIVQEVRFDLPCDLVGITANTPAAPHCLPAGRGFPCARQKVVIGGPHATLLPEEVLRHADAVVVGEAELVWGSLLEDFERNRLKAHYESKAFPQFGEHARPRWDLIKGRFTVKALPSPHAAAHLRAMYCTIPAMYRRRMR
jgi:radical SAM superfamily enzyme YgiQ (UPF0313 family)